MIVNIVLSDIESFQYSRQFFQFTLQIAARLILRDEQGWGSQSGPVSPWLSSFGEVHEENAALARTQWLGGIRHYSYPE